MLKKIIMLGVLLIGLISSAPACELCEEQQPAWLKGVVHGPGPGNGWDYVIMVVSILIVLAVLYFSIKFLIKPGEKDPAHIKYSILNPQDTFYGK
ncbi:MAG TPA: hypothetical protein VFX43_07695 [Chitinophagaceae bacterium]|nr:hypothetical protein [Chitinophagaceae bacterium]